MRACLSGPGVQNVVLREAGGGAAEACSFQQAALDARRQRVEHAHGFQQVGLPATCLLTQLPLLLRLPVALPWAARHVGGLPGIPIALVDFLACRFAPHVSNAIASAGWLLLLTRGGRGGLRHMRVVGQRKKRPTSRWKATDAERETN